MLAAVLLLSLVLAAADGIGQAARAHGRTQLEIALRRAAVACYAAEGVYPPDVAWLQDHYGIQIDHRRYAVDYQIFAENLMPSITVLEREP